MHKVKLPLKYSQFGSESGRLVIYFHGAPGAPEECSIFDSQGNKHGLTFICFDRFSIDTSIKGERYYKLLAEEISKRAGTNQVDVIGFSIGAFIALQTCRYLANQVKSLHLISAAVPGCRSIKVFSSLSHYSCLASATPEICKQLGEP
jgi:pimeloyl-ACP methyl ester carboxylesterase